MKSADELNLRPPHIVLAENEKISAEMAAGGDGAIERLLPLTVNDCGVIGLVVQTFAYCDMNARRGLDIIDVFEGKSVPDVKHTPRENEILTRLAERSKVLPIADDERRSLMTAITMLNQFVHIRHHFAHWAARRHPKYDTLVMLTFNRREAARKLDHSPERFKASFAVVPMPEVRANLSAMQKNSDFIAARVSDWYQRFVPPTINAEHSSESAG